jgi:hypothetical protein
MSGIHPIMMEKAKQPWLVRLEAGMGKHPDLMVDPPTSTIILTNDRNFEISQFFAKNFEKV